MLDQYVSALKNGYSDQEIAQYLSKDKPDEYKAAVDNGYSQGEIARFLSGVDENEWQDNITRESNLSNMGDSERGFKQGIHNMKSGAYGVTALAGSLAKKAGLDTVGKSVQDWGMEGYKRNEREASLYPTKSFSDIHGVGDFADYIQGLAASQVPVLAEVIAGSVLSGGVGYGLAKKGISSTVKHAAKSAIEKQIQNGVLKKAGRKAAETALEKSLVKGLIKTQGRGIVKKAGELGMVGTVSQMEAGLNYGELLNDHGIDAPVSSLAFGTLSGYLETLGGNIGLVDDFVGAVARKMPGSYIKRAAARLAKNVPAEAMQEAGQEVNSILNIVLNTDEKFLTPDNMKRIMESAAGGGFFGAGGAFVQAGMSGDSGVESSPAKALSNDPVEAEAADQKNKDDLDKVIAGESIADESDQLGDFLEEYQRYHTPVTVQDKQTPFNPPDLLNYDKNRVRVKDIKPGMVPIDTGEYKGNINPQGTQGGAAAGRIDQPSDNLGTTPSFPQFGDIADRTKDLPATVGDIQNKRADLDLYLKDQAINKFENDLAKAQSDIKDYSQPEATPEMTPDAVEVINRQAAAEQQAEIDKADKMVDSGDPFFNPDRVEREKKQPWEMTREEYVKSNPDELTGDKNFLSRRLFDKHENVISEAYKSGKTIPKEVLKDYPEIVLGDSEIGKRGKEQYNHKQRMRNYDFSKPIVFNANEEKEFRRLYDSDNSRPKGYYEYLDNGNIKFVPNKTIKDNQVNRNETLDGKIRNFYNDLQGKHISQVKQYATEYKNNLSKNLTKKELIKIAVDGYSQEIEHQPVSKKLNAIGKKLPRKMLESGRIEAFDTIRKNIYSGKTTPEQIKSDFESLLENKEQIIAELSKLPKSSKKKGAKTLLGMLSGMGQSRYKSEKKALVVKAVYSDMVDAFNITGSLQYDPMEKDGATNAIRKKIAKYTQEDLDRFAERVKKNTEEYIAERKKMIEGIKNPQTLKDFDNFFNYGTGKLTPEQQEKYDNLKSDSIKGRQQAQIDAKSTIKAVNTDTGFEIIEGVHTKKGHAIFTVKMDKRVDRDTFKELRSRAKQIGGYYSMYRGNGAVPGFIFPEKAMAEKFVALKNGDVSVKEEVQKKAVGKAKLNIIRLKKMADKAEAAGKEKLNQDRQTNTAKRAGQVASAEADARATIAFAKTLRKIAEGIEAGTIKYLSNLKNKTQLTTLYELLNAARWESIRVEDTSGMTFAEREAHRTRAAVPSDIANAAFPKLSADTDNLNRLAEELAGIKGGKLLSKQILSRIKGSKRYEFKSSYDENIIRKAIKKAVAYNKGKSWSEAIFIPGYLETAIVNRDRLIKMGIETDEQTRSALRELIALNVKTEKENPVVAAERDLVGKKPGVDFFPAPKTLANNLVERADIQAGDIILEPSAGKGDIADAIKKAHPGNPLDVVELSSSLRKILKLKKHNLVDRDFLEHDGEYDKIIMNPPFSKGMDVDHVKHAYSLLKPGGKIVAIMGEHPFFANDKKSVEFREWLSDKGFDEKLPEGSFKGKEAFRQTGVNSRIVEIEKPIGVSKKSNAKFQTTNNLTNNESIVNLTGKKKLKALYQSKQKGESNGRTLAQKRSSLERDGQPGNRNKKDNVKQGDVKTRFHKLLGFRDKDGTTKLTHSLTKKRRQLQKIAKAFGKQVVFFTSKDPQINKINGFTEPTTGTEIFINANSTDPLISIIGHELIHQLKYNHPELYEFLSNQVRVSDKGFDEYIENFMGSRENSFTSVSDKDILYEEFIGDFASDQFQRVEFWQKLLSENRTFTEKIIDILQGILDKIKTLFPRAEQFVSNFEESQAALAYAMNEAMRRDVDAMGEGGSGNPLFATTRTADKWFSALSKAVKAVGQKVMPGKMWAQLMSSNKFKQAGVKEEEVEWSGVKDWLSSKKKVTKSELLDYLKENNVEIVEVVKGDMPQEAKYATADQIWDWDDDGEVTDWAVDSLPEAVDGYDEDTGSYMIDYDKIAESKQWFISDRSNDGVYLTTSREDAIRESSADNTKFSEYQLPGGANYKEILLTLPNKLPSNLEINKGDDGYYVEEKGKPGQKSFGFGTTKEQALNDYFKQSGAQSYTSTHYDEKNIIAHVRISDRMVDGKKILHVEEVQSDYAQDARKKGVFKKITELPDTYKVVKYNNPESLNGDPLLYKGKPATHQWVVESENGGILDTNTNGTKDEVIKSAIKRLNELSAKGSIPDAPFIKSTKAWSMLAMKRLVRMAAEGGYDGLAWTGGREQVSRYKEALRKAVDKIKWTKTENGIQLIGYKNGKQVVDTVEKENEVSDAIGKTMGESIIEDKDQSGIIEGDNITISDTGMAGFYDKMLVNNVNKFFNKAAWGKAKVGEIEIGENPGYRVKQFLDGSWGVVDKNGDFVGNVTVDTKSEAEKDLKNGLSIKYHGDTKTLHYLPITDKMRSKAMTEGMPLFQTVSGPQTEAFKKWFGDSKVVDENGDPLVVYHGTPDGRFTIFDEAKRGLRSTGHFDKSRAFHFTDNRNVAVAYSESYLNKNIDYEINGISKSIKREGSRPFASEIPVYLSINNPLRIKYSKEITEKVISQAKKDGYDGIITNMGNGAEYVVFSPTQIKSATGNRGTYDQNNPDIRYQTTANAKSTTTDNTHPLDNDSLFRKASDLVLGNIAHRKDKGKNYSEDISTMAHIFKTTMYNAEKIGGAYKRLWNTIRKQDDYKFEAQRKLWYDGDESILEQFKAFEKKSKLEYAKLKNYLLDRDINRRGFIVKEDASTGKAKLLHWQKKNGKRIELGEYDDVESAWEDGIFIEAAKADLSHAGKDALMNFRKMSHNLYHYFAKNAEEAISAYEKAGQPLPQIIVQTEDGTTKIGLRAAANKMGDLRGSYFPRLRNSGQWRVIGSKADTANEIQFFDTRIAANSYRKKLERNGYKTEIKQVGKFSEDIFQALEPLFAQQQILNKALKDISNTDKQRVLEDAGIKGLWRGDTFVLSGKINDITEAAVAHMGGKLKERWTNRSVRFEIVFEDIQEQNPYEFEQKVTDAILHSGGLDVDIDLAFANAMVKQYDAILKGRGARSRMIARDDAVGTSVAQGYEKDPVIAITQAMQAAAGSEAKAIIAKEGSAAIAGRDISWQDYKKDNMGAVTKLESELDALSLNSESEKQRKKELDEQLLSVRRGLLNVTDPTPNYIIKKQRQIKNILQEMKNLVRWSDIDKAKALKTQITMAKQGIYRDYLKLVESRKLDAKKQPKAFKEATGALEDILRNQEFADKVLGTIKGLAVWQYLGFRVSSAAVNVTNMITGVPAAINGETDNKVSLSKSITYVGKAMKDFALHRAGKLAGEKKKVFDEIQERGWDNPVFNREAFDVLSTKLGRGWNFALEKSMWMFGKTEELNRAATIAATYFAMKDVNKGAWDHDAMMEKAKDISDKAHGVYSKANRPFQMRGGNLAGRILQAGYVFQTFIHNYMQEMYRLGFDKGQVKAALYMAFSPALFGIGATIPIGIAKAISRAFGGDDPEEKLIQLAEDSFGAGDVVRNGIMGFGDHGINLRGSLSTRFGVPSTFADIFGAPGSVVSDIWEGGKNITKGYYQEGFEKMAPAAFGNISKGFRESTTGVTTRSGTPVFWGKEQLKSDPVDMILRMMSFNPTGISKKKEIQWHEYKVMSKYRDKKSEIYKKLKRFYSKPVSARSRKDMIKIKADIRDFNSEIKDKAITRYVSTITDKSIKSVLRRTKRPPKRERLRKLPEQTKILQKI